MSWADQRLLEAFLQSLPVSVLSLWAASLNTKVAEQSSQIISSAMIDIAFASTLNMLFFHICPTIKRSGMQKICRAYDPSVNDALPRGQWHGQVLLLIKIHKIIFDQ